jgi:hypothetical protein
MTLKPNQDPVAPDLREEAMSTLFLLLAETGEFHLSGLAAAEGLPLDQRAPLAEHCLNVLSPKHYDEVVRSMGIYDALALKLHEELVLLGSK